MSCAQNKTLDGGRGTVDEDVVARMDLYVGKGSNLVVNLADFVLDFLNTVNDF